MVSTVTTRPGRILLTSLAALACDGAVASTGPEPRLSIAAARSEMIAGGGGVSLALYEAGSADDQPIVFIHGFTQNALTWDRQFADLGDRFHVIAYDMRGHGASAKPLDAESYTSSPLWADDIDAVIRARDLEKPILVGWSYGGFVIADYVRKYGDDALGGLVFVDAITKNGTEEAAGYLTEEVLAIFGDLLSADVRTSIAATRTLTRMFGEPKPDTWEIAFGSAMMVPSQVRLAMFSRLLDNDDVLAAIGVPTLVVHGGSDRLVRLSAAQHTAATVPGARLLVYQGSGHTPYIDMAQRFNRDLAGFARSIR